METVVEDKDKTKWVVLLEMVDLVDKEEVMVVMTYMVDQEETSVVVTEVLNRMVLRVDLVAVL